MQHWSLHSAPWPVRCFVAPFLQLPCCFVAPFLQLPPSLLRCAILKLCNDTWFQHQNDPEMGTRFFWVTLESPTVGIKFGSICFERVNSIESLGRSVAKGLYNSWLYQASDGGSSNSGCSGWQSQCITRSAEYTVTSTMFRSLSTGRLRHLWPCHYFKAWQQDI